MSLASRMSSYGPEGSAGESEYKWDESVLGDMHLNSAINLDLFKHYYNEDPPKYRVKENRKITNELEELQRGNTRGYRREIGFQRLFSRMFSAEDGMSKMESKMTKMIMKILKGALAEYNMKIPLANVTEVSIDEGCEVPSVLRDWFDFLLKCIYARSEWIRSEGSVIRFKATSDGNFIRKERTSSSGSYVVLMGKEVVEIRIPKERVRYVADYSSLLLLLDVAGQRICAHLCSKMGTITGVPGSLNGENISRLCGYGDALIEKCGNQAYEVLGMFESTCVGTLLEKSPDGITNNMQFSENCNQEMHEMIEEMPHKEFVRGITGGIYACIRDMQCEEISNAFCLYRIWGHPTVDILKGMEKVHKIGTQEKVIPPGIGKIMLCQFRKMFLTTYFKKHHSYPKYEGEPEGYLKKCLEERIPIRIDNPAYNIRDFESVKILETYRVPETYDMCHILNDKAVSPDLSELVESIKSGRGTSCGAKRRGILRWMEGQSINCREFLSDISAHGLTKEDLLIGMYEKEREIKVAARMYSLMTERMRYYFVLTEGLIADHILPHFPEITMKDSLNVLLKKMWESGGQRSVGSLDVNINIDFSKWNTNMRDDLTRLVFQEMDSIFGFEGLISRTHGIFENSLIYSASGKYLPVVEGNEIVEDAPMCYRGHLGGFEGLRQKGWTVATVCLLAYLSEQQKVGMNLMGQGDNQIIRLKMPVSYWNSLKLSGVAQRKAAGDATEKFVEAMDTMFSGAGLPIKVRETWKSARLFMYGKVMLLDGRQLPQWYKKTLRSYALSNEGTLTISGVMGTIATNMCAAGSGSETPCMMYLFFLLLAEWSLGYMFQYHPFTRGRISDGDTLDFKIIEGRRRSYKTTNRVNTLWLKALLTLVPTAVGGSVTIPLTGFIMRGFPDKASEGYAWLKFLMGQKSPIQSYLRNFYTFLPNDTVEADMLIQSPFSLNHKRPPTPGLQTRENIREWLLSTPRFQQNRFIRGMRDLLSGFDKKKVCAELLTENMNPLISHEVYETFGQVYCEGIVARVENTRTIRTLHLSREDREPIVSKLMEDEMSYIGYMWWRGSTTGSVNNPCATKQARESRNIGWGRKIMGITTPHPLEVLFERVCKPGGQCKWDDDHITSKMVDEGQFPPFLGSKIKNKVYSLQDEEARREPLIRTGARLARQFNWTDMGKNLRSLVIKNVGALCDVSVFDKFVDDDPSDNLYTGSVMHRFTPAAVSEGCFINYAPQRGHRVFMSSDTLPSLSRGQTNYTFHFQAMYCFLQYCVSHEADEGAYHHHVGCQDCIVPVEDEFDDISSETPGIESSQQDRYIDIIRSTLGYIGTKPQNLVIKGEETPLGIVVDTVAGQEKKLYEGVVDILCWKSASDLLNRTKDTYTSVGTEDLQGWPRVYAYKVSRRQIVSRVSAFILFMTAAKMGEAPVAHNMERIRRRAIDHVSSVAVEGFSGVATLCLGRDFPFGDPEIVIIEGYAYPETVSTCVRSLKASILLTVGRIVNPGRFVSSRCIYPTESFTSREFLGLLSCKSSLLRGCSALQDAWEGMKEAEICYAKVICQHHCMEQMIRQNRLVHMTLDRAVKYLPILARTTDNKVGVPVPQSIKSSVKVHVEGRASSDTHSLGVEGLHPHVDRASVKMVQYPTSSIYKWSDILSGGHHAEHVVVLGDGTGGTSLVASRVYPDANIYPMALLESKNLIPQDLGSLSPPMSRHVKNVKNDMLIDLPDDITKPSFVPRLASRVSLMSGKVLVLSDIEGRGNMCATVIQALVKMPPFTDVIVKVYIEDLNVHHYLLRGISNLEILISPLGNLRYGEVFLKFRVSSGPEGARAPAIATAVRQALERISQLKDETIMSTVSSIELAFATAVEANLNIAFMKLASWGGAFPMKIMQEENMKLAGYVYQYINTHYHFSSASYRPGDGRTVTPMRSDNLRALMRAVLLGIYGEGADIVEELERMSLIGVKDGLHGRPYFKIAFHYGVSRVLLSKDEVRVGRVIRNYRARKYEQIVQRGPIGTPFEGGSLRKIMTWGYKVPVSLSKGWIDEHLHV